jgi:quinol monooxygenase YgiN
MIASHAHDDRVTVAAGLATPSESELWRLALDNIQRIGPTIATTIFASNAGQRMVAMVQVALLVRLEAKPGKADDVARLLKGALPLANAEPATTVWFALQVGPSTFGIFDAFPDDAGRQAHLAGSIAAALMARAPDLLSQPPTIEAVDVLAAKL